MKTKSILMALIIGAMLVTVPSHEAQLGSGDDQGRGCLVIQTEVCDGGAD